MTSRVAKEQVSEAEAANLSASFELALEGVGKMYGETSVLRNVDLFLRSGECTTLVGENGAGKSTLVGILSGRIQPSGGSLLLDGIPVNFPSSKQARAAGIAVIPQELAGVPEMSVAENIMLSNLPPGQWHVSQRWMRREASTALERLGIEMDVRRTLAGLPLAERQFVEIAKALSRNARLLILDEPTASLHAAEAESLLNRLQELKATGTSLVYVSHHLDECFQISDRVLVLRNGDVVARAATAVTTPAETVAHMLGREYQEPDPRDRVADAPPAIEIRSWSRTRQPALRDVSFALHEGEILGIFGLVGSGAETVARALGGHDSDVAGALRRPPNQNHSAPKSPRHARRLGIAYVPAERKVDGLALSQSVEANVALMSMRSVSKWGWLSRRRGSQLASAQVEAFSVRCRSTGQEIGELSGGNQQKVLLASRILASPQILVLHEPTRGVDIGARAQIHQSLADVAQSGTAVLLVTSDLQEAVAATDRLLVMRDGEIVAELVGREKSESSALAIATGGSK